MPLVVSSRTKRRFLAIFFIALFLSWSVLLYFISPSDLANAIGTKHGYTITFFFALLGGTSIFFPFPYYLIVATLAAGGLNPFILALFAAAGVALGDSTSYFVGYHGRYIVPSRFSRFLNRFSNWCMRRSLWTLYPILFLYSALIPLPNDLLVVPLGLGKYPYYHVIIPLALGNFTFNIGVAMFGMYGLSSLF